MYLYNVCVLVWMHILGKTFNTLNNHKIMKQKCVGRQESIEKLHIEDLIGFLDPHINLQTNYKLIILLDTYLFSVQNDGF